jgi:hypothetical protein
MCLYTLDNTLNKKPTILAFRMFLRVENHCYVEIKTNWELRNELVLDIDFAPNTHLKSPPTLQRRPSGTIKFNRASDLSAKQLNQAAIGRLSALVFTSST